MCPSKKSPEVLESSEYITPKELARRWGCSRSSVDRYAHAAGLTRLCLGYGKNGMVRYLRKEVIAYEQERLVSMN
jgi:predicted DNA-binding transcriptional regulator AlpA